MAPTPVVYGEWAMGNSSWHFMVDTTKGGRMFFLNNDITFGRLLEMAQEDFGLHMNADSVLLSYSLPEAMLQQMGPGSSFPPIYITNDSGVRNFLELSRSQMVRLCVSQRSIGVENMAEACDEPAKMDETFDGNYEDESDDNIDEDEDVDEENDGGSDSSVCQAGEEQMVDDNVEGDTVEGLAQDVDYSKIGKVEAEYSEDVHAFDFEAMKESLRLKGRQFMHSWSDGIYEGGSFDSKEVLMSELRLTAVMAKFAFRVDKSTKGLFVAKCRVKGCKWQLRASVKNEPSIFWVTGYSKYHTCTISDRIAARKENTPKYIATLFWESTGLINRITPEDIKKCMFVMFGVKMNYTTSYRAFVYLHKLVRGSHEDGYAQLPSYLHKLCFANPGTRATLEVDDENRFKCLFMALGASVSGFQFLRRVIVVDGCHLPGKYGGVMLVATGQDGNFQLFPLAFAIVDSENDESWEWFFTKLKDCVSNQGSLTIISDRHMSIKNAVEKVFPRADRGICYYHLQTNIVKKFKGKHMLYLVKNAAYAYTINDFDRYMGIIREMNPELANYLVEADVRLWARAHFPGLRYNIQTSNIAESVNSMLKLARTFPIASLLEFIRDKLSVWYCKRRAEALSLTTPHSRAVEYLLAVRDYYANKYSVQRLDGWRFLVKGGHRDCIVDFQHRRCYCGLWDVEKIPCGHAIAASPAFKIPVKDLVCPSYRKESLYSAYEGKIFPLDDEFKAPDNDICLPPIVRSQPGRKKKSRWQSWLEIASMKGKKPRKMHKQYSCSKCRQPGHKKPECVS